MTRYKAVASCSEQEATAQVTQSSDGTGTTDGNDSTRLAPTDGSTGR